MDEMESEKWAREEFGSAALGDKRRTARLVQMTQRMAQKPAGKLTRVFEFAGELEGAYRFVENEDVSIEEMERARGEACARRLAGQEVAVVAVDQTSIELREHRKTKNMGSVGTRRSGARGVQTMVALALTEEGVPMGAAGLRAWLRDEVPSPMRKNGRTGKRNDKRPPEARESFHWIETFDLCHEQLRLHAPGTRAWYQVDQGADYWRVFEWASEHDVWLTARVCHERVVTNRGHKSYLHPWIADRPVAYRFDLELPARSGRPARTAHLRVRYATTTIRYMTTQKKELHLRLSVVAVHEPRPPADAEPLDWLLLTTFPVETDADAARVIANYKLRWRRIEVIDRDQAHPQFGVAPGQRRHHAREELAREQLRRRDPQHPARLEHLRPRLADRRLGPLEHPAAARREHLARGRQLERPPVPREQLDPDLGLERRQPAADRLLRQLERARGRDEPPVIGDGEEDPERLEFHARRAAMLPNPRSIADLDPPFARARRHHPGAATCGPLLALHRAPPLHRGNSTILPLRPSRTACATASAARSSGYVASTSDVISPANSICANSAYSARTCSRGSLRRLRSRE